MLKALIKYDLRFIINKALVIYYAVSVFLGLLTRLMFLIDGSVVLNVIAQICSGAAISTMISILINTVIRCWVRFRPNFYGDESYLTHTLPIRKSTQYTAKFLSATISLITGFGVVLVTLFLAYYSKENMELFKSMLLPLADSMDSSAAELILILIAVLLVELLNMVQSGYLGIILGHQKNSGKTGLSVLFGAIVYIVSQGVVLLISFLMTMCFNDDAFRLFTENTITDFSVFKSLALIALVAYGIILAVGFFLSVRCFQKGVNVD